VFRFASAAIHIESPLPNFIFKSITLKTIHGRKIFHTWEMRWAPAPAPAP
jgi:hypothetical protein